MNVTYQHATHAPLYERYMPDGEFHEVGEAGMYGPVHPETGAEFRALGSNHKYSTDYEVGASYPPCVFVTARDGGDSLTHDELESLLRYHELWSDALTPVLLPKALEGGEATWWYGFQFKPVERSPRLSRVCDQLEDRAEHPDYVSHTRSVVEGQLPPVDEEADR